MRKKAVLIVALTLASLVVATVYWWRIEHGPSTLENTLVLYGNVDIREVRVAFNGNEHVGEILVEEGDRVEPGQLLARLHTERLQAARDRVSAELVAARAEADVARLRYERIKSLVASKVASEEEADESRATSLAASAQVAAAEAVLAEADQLLNDAELRSPVSGVVRERIVEPGDFVTPQNPVLTLALTDRIWVRTYLPESYLGQVRPGARAWIKTDSFPNKDYEGWVGFISPTAEFTPKNVETPELRTRLVYQIRVFACNPALELRLGMPATVTVPLAQENSAAKTPERRCGQQRSTDP